MKPASSLRLRLLVGVLATVATAWLAVAAAGYFKARHELDELLDAHLAQSAGILLALLGEEADEIELEHAPRLHRYERQVAFQIWDRNQRLRMRSASAPASRLSPAEEGFSTQTTEGTRWRVFSLRSDAQGVSIQVGERLEAREDVSGEIAEQLLAPLGFALPLLAGLLVLAIGRALKPLNTMAREVAARDAQRLEPIGAEEAPAEVRPLVNQLNALFSRINQSLENERRFTADAAHELRTPIAAIRAQAQVAQTATDTVERLQALGKVLAGCDRATRLTEQLLTLARLDAGTSTPPVAHCDLAQSARSVLAELGPSAHEQGVELELVSPTSVFVRGEVTLLQVMIRNLVDNAVRYSPATGRVTVKITEEEERVRLEVGDRGPGIPAEERQRVLQRFYRIVGGEATGSGLGLSIVTRVADLHGAHLSMTDGTGGKGLKVIVSFPEIERKPGMKHE